MPKKKDLLDALLEKGLLKQEGLSLVNREAKSRGVTEEQVILERGLVNEEELARAKGEILNIPVKIFRKDETVPREILAQVPEESARHYNMVALGKEDGALLIGMLNPDDVRAEEALKFIVQKLNTTAKIFLVTRQDLYRLWKGYRSFGEEITNALRELQTQFPAGRRREALQPFVKLEEAEIARHEEAPIIRMVSAILRQGVIQRASDIHIEPEKTRLRVRYRIDGSLFSMLLLPLEIQSPVVTRIKIMANLKIDETRIPQDGRFRTIIDEREIDFRIATFPTASGEKVAIRILDPATGLKGLEELGLSDWNLKILKEGMEKPFGMILSTGPTGSGKSTTLYAILQILNNEDANIVTLEDPVEYFVAGINQSQVLPEIGYTFAAGLRQIVRQDPDIIMVGEIRDNETAQLAVHAALTGHIVLSTLHTNDAVGVMPRLIDLGVQPFLLPATLNLMISQRLVRRLCPDCKKKVKVEAEELEKVIDEALHTLPEKAKHSLRHEKPYTIYEPQGCPTCNNKGTLGRVGVYEILRMTPELEKIILSGVSESTLREEAIRQGMVTMHQEGVLKALEGLVDLEEVLQETTT
ncbi:MAG: Flp pilus assembly complex ATPase component TadA [Parcubacteria group bacterium]|nr:Flp pilus assembly complex ATPase component TadA [Parcubacteria group bacterium]